MCTSVPVISASCHFLSFLHQAINSTAEQLPWTGRDCSKSCGNFTVNTLQMTRTDEQEQRVAISLQDWRPALAWAAAQAMAAAILLWVVQGNLWLWRHNLQVTLCISAAVVLWGQASPVWCLFWGNCKALASLCQIAVTSEVWAMNP